MYKTKMHLVMCLIHKISITVTKYFFGYVSPLEFAHDFYM